MPALLAGIAALLCACGMTQTPFARTSGEIASEFAAAEETLRLVHADRLTAAYATSAFATYRVQLEGADRELAGLDGAPDDATVRRLVDAYRSAFTAIEAPCLQASCDWSSQADALGAAGDAFREAAGA